MHKALLIMVVGSASLWAQAQSGASAAPKVDRGSAYYHYTLAHMYAELAGAYGNRGDYVNQAIDNYKQAIKADPSAPMLSSKSCGGFRPARGLN